MAAAHPVHDGLAADAGPVDQFDHPVLRRCRDRPVLGQMDVMAGDLAELLRRDRRFDADRLGDLVAMQQIGDRREMAVGHVGIERFLRRGDVGGIGRSGIDPQRADLGRIAHHQRQHLAGLEAGIAEHLAR